MCDFGDAFEVTDHNGVEPSEFLIGHITKVSDFIVPSLPPNYGLVYRMSYPGTSREPFRWEVCSLQFFDKYLILVM